MYYLSEKNWSHRFEKRFFTIKMDNPSVSLDTEPYYDKVGGRKKLPAYYYIIQVCPGTSTAKEGEVIEPIKVFRRYSEFEWLYYKLKSNPPPNAQTEGSFPTLPPKTRFCQMQTKEFRYNRQKELFDFLDHVLSMHPSYATHNAMKAFLMLDTIYIGDSDDKSVKSEDLTKLKEELEKEETGEDKGETGGEVEVETAVVAEPVVEEVKETTEEMKESAHEEEKVEETIISHEIKEKPIEETAPVAESTDEKKEEKMEEQIISDEMKEKPIEEKSPVAESTEEQKEEKMEEQIISHEMKEKPIKETAPVAESTDEQKEEKMEEQIISHEIKEKPIEEKSPVAESTEEQKEEKVEEPIISEEIKENSIEKMPPVAETVDEITTEENIETPKEEPTISPAETETEKVTTETATKSTSDMSAGDSI